MRNSFHSAGLCLVLLLVVIQHLDVDGGGKLPRCVQSGCANVSVAGQLICDSSLRAEGLRFFSFFFLWPRRDLQLKSPCL